MTGPINIGNPNEYPIRELAELIIEMNGTRSKIRFEPLPSDDLRQRRPDISMVRSIQSGSPKTQLREGLTKTITYFENVLRKEGSRWREPGGRLTLCALSHAHSLVRATKSDVRNGPPGGAIVTKAEFEISVFQMLIQRCAVFGTQGSKSRPNRARS